MTLIILAGVWALAFGQLTLTNDLKMKGNNARIFGVISLLVAAYVLPYLTGFFNGYAPGIITGNEVFHEAFNMLIGAATLYASAWMARPVLPKLRIPSITVSVKRAKS